MFVTFTRKKWDLFTKSLLVVFVVADYEERNFLREYLKKLSFCTFQFHA